MKRFNKLTAWLLTLAMLMTIMPSFTLTVSAAETYDLWVGGEQFTSEKLIITDGNDGKATYDPDKNTLTLNNYTYEGAGYGDAAIRYSGDKLLNLVLVGESAVTQQSDTAPSYSYGVIATSSITVSGEGSLIATGGEAIYGGNGVYVFGYGSVSSITVMSGRLTGVGTTPTDTEYNDNSGVQATDKIIVLGGELNGIGGDTSAYYNYSYGVYAEDSITVSGGKLNGIGGKLGGNGGAVDSSDYSYSFGAYTNGSIIVENNGSLTATGGTANASYGILTNEIEVTDGTVKAIGGAGNTSYGICDIGGYIVVDDGMLDAIGGEATRGSYGIRAMNGDVIIEDGAVTAMGGRLTGTGGVSIGISAGTIVVLDGTVDATGENYGIFADIEMLGGEVNATGGAVPDGDFENYGISGEIDIIGGTLTATGGTGAFKFYEEASPNIEMPMPLIKAGTSVTNANEITRTELDESYTTVTIDEGDNAYTYTYTYTYTTYTYVRIANADGYYPIWVKGELVTKDNKADVLGDGTVSYDPDTNTLTLNNADITGILNGTTQGAGVFATGNLNLNLSGENTVTGATIQGYSAPTVMVMGDLTISGSGSLDAQGGIVVQMGDITIESGTVKATGGPGWQSYGIYVVEGDVIIKGGYVTATGGAGDMSYGICVGDGDVTIESGIVTAVGETIGIYTYNLMITGGDVTVTATSDVDEYVALVYNSFSFGEYVPWMKLGTDNAEPVDAAAWIEEEDNDLSLYKHVHIYPKDSDLLEVTYTDGVKGEEIFADVTYQKLVKGVGTPAFGGATPTRIGYTFTGWSPAVTDAVTENVTYTAQWRKKSSGGGGGGSSSNTTTTTTKNDDGSTTKTTTNKSTGTVTEVTTNTDGSTTTVETKKDGTVTTTEKDKDGNTTTTVEKPDGTSTTIEKNKDGSEKVTENKADGTTVTTEKDTDGTKTVTTENADGSTTTEEVRKDGTEVKTETNANGETTAKVEAKGETEVVIPVENAEDVTSITVTDKDGKETEITDFEITENGVKVTVSGDCTVVLVGGDAHIAPSKKEFADVHPVGHWATADIDYAYIKGLMMGTSETHFSPDVPLTRAMLVTVLYRLEGEPATNRSIPFADVDMGAYYGRAVSWAKQNGIVKGVSETEFAPNSNITREQIAAIMHRYAQYKGYDVESGENTNILSYDDFDSISEYAIPSVQWAVGSGLMKGKSESTLNPLDNATRAETAAILHRFIEANK